MMVTMFIFTFFFSPVFFALSSSPLMLGYRFYSLRKQDSLSFSW